MGTLIRPQGWAQQPQGPVDLDWSNPLTPDFVFNGGSGGVLIGRNRYLAIGRGASDVFHASNYGLGYKPTRVANAGLDFGLVQPITSDAWTVLVLANPTSSAVGTLFSQRNGSAPYNQITLAANSNDSLALRAGGFAGIALGKPSGVRGAVSTLTNAVNGDFHVFGMARSGTTSAISLYHDGLSISATLTGTGTNTAISASQKTRIGNIADYTADAAYVAESNIPMVFIYNRALTGSEIAKVSADMLRGAHFWAKGRPSRLFFSTVVGGTSLFINKANHTHATDSLSFSLDTYLAASKATHAHSSDSLVLSADSLLAVQEALHFHTADSPSLSTAAYLSIAHAVHAQFADDLTIDASGATILTTQDAAHAHTSDGLTLTLDTWLAIVEATHGHLADSPVLSSEEALLVAGALHAHYADVVVLGFPSAPGSCPTVEEIVAAVLAALNATTIPVDVHKVLTIPVTGNWPTANENADALLARAWP